nr:Mariner Mos1 transposase [Hymenolepis microstoma]
MIKRILVAERVGGSSYNVLSGERHSGEEEKVVEDAELEVSVIERPSVMRLSRAQEKEKRPQYNERHDKVVVLQHDNARSPHVAKMLLRPIFSSPTSFNSTRLAHQHLRSYEEAKNWTHRLMDLIERWETC